MKKVAIIGGGISGLTAAYRLSQSELARKGQLEIHVYEASPRFGGVIQTERQKGLLMERGPDSFITAKPAALELCKELGLEGQFLETNPKQRQSFILSRDKLIPVPKGFYLMAPAKISEAIKTPLLSWRGKIRMACEFFIPPKKNAEDESLASFVRRRFGRELLERIAQPMIAGIYTADPEELSLEATFPHFLKMEKEHGSVIRALRKQKNTAMSAASGPRYSLFLSLSEGLGALVDRLIERMPDVHFHASSKVTRLEKGHLWKLVLEGGTSHEYAAICSALSAPLSAHLLKGVANDLEANLIKIPYENVATVNLVFRRKDIKHPLNGLGYVVAAIEKKMTVGCTFSSVKFPDRVGNDGTVLLRAFLGGKASADLLKLDDEKVVQTVCKEVSKQLGIENAPKATLVSRWQAAIPQYLVGHRKRVREIFEVIDQIPGLYLTGNAYGGTGIPDCIQHASQTADKMLVESLAAQEDD